MVVVASVVMLFRFLRPREIEAFQDADMSNFRDFSGARPESALSPEQESQVNVVQLKAAAAAAPKVYASRQMVLDEPRQLFQTALEASVGEGVRVMPRVPLTEVIHADDKAAEHWLRSRTLSFAVCSHDFTLLCGVHLAGASGSEKQTAIFFEDVFSQANKPLLTFPLMAPPSAAELEEMLMPVFGGSPLSLHCPRCGKEMSMGKAVKGRNAGKSFWVCKEFPSCQGITRIGQT